MAQRTQTTLFKDEDEVQAETPQTLTTREAAARLGLSQRRTQKLAKARVLQCVLHRGVYRIYTASVDQYIQQCAQGQRPAAPVAGGRPNDASGCTLQGPEVLPQAQPPDVPAPQLTVLLQRVGTLEHRLMTVEREREELVEVLKQELAAAKQREADLRRLLQARRGRTAPPSPRAPRSRPAPQRESVLEALRQANRPRRAWQLATVLGLPVQRVQRELSRLVRRGEAKKTGRLGVYVAVGVPIATEPGEVEPARPPSLLERVWQTVQQADHPLQAKEVRQRLQMDRDPSPELSRLFKQGRVRRKMGHYSVPDGPGAAGEKPGSEENP